MSLRAFHGVFIACSLALLGFLAWWATGHNAGGVRAPWLLWASALGAALVAPYFRWYLRELRSRP